MAAGRGHGGRRRGAPWWVRLPLDELLDLRLKDLDLRIEGTALERRVQQLHAELGRAGLRFRPHVWLSTSWFTPDGVAGFAIPFFLAHPRLARLEHREMLEVEGGSHDWCMKLLRHETGHALDNVYRLHWRKRWRETFGAFSQSYRTSYRPRPTSKRFVVNLDHWYAQSHPGEDWAETFAVWLWPGSDWRRHYAGWPARKKVEFVDALMAEVRTEKQKVLSRAKPDALHTLSLTLREYYQRKKDWYGLHLPEPHEHHLQRLFSGDPAYASRPSAAAFLRRHRHELRTMVSAVTGQYRYVVDQALKDMIAGAKKHHLRLTRSERESRVGAAILLTMLTTSFLQGTAREFSR